MRPLVIRADPRVLLWPANGPVTGLHVLFRGRPDSLPPLMFLLLPGPPRLDLPVVTLMLAVPVLRSVRRLLCAPCFLCPYFRTGPPRHSSSFCATHSSLRFVTTPICGSRASIVRATCASTTPAAHRPLASRPECGGAGGDVRQVASAVAGGR
jgi:hypothetical protein